MSVCYRRRLLWAICACALVSLTTTSRLHSESLAPDALVRERAKHLRDLAQAYFELSTAEIRLLDAAPSGDLVQIDSSKDLDPASIPDDTKHSIDANLIRWLLTDIDAQKLIDPSGVRIRGAVIDGTLNLDDLTITLPLSLVRCKIDSGMELIATRARVLNLERSKVSWIEAPGLSLDRDLFLQDGRYGQIILQNATLGGTVHLEGAMLGDVSNDYLSSDNALLDLRASDTQASINLNDVRIIFHSEIPTAIDATGAVVHRDFILDGLTTTSSQRASSTTLGLKPFINLSRTRIDGVLQLSEAQLAPSLGGLNLVSIKAQSIVLDHMSSAWIWAPGAVTEMDFSAKYGHFGQIVLSDSKIGGNLYITHSTLGDVAAPNPKYALLDINNSEIGSSIYLDGASTVAKGGPFAIDGNSSHIHGDAAFFSGQGVKDSDAHLSSDGVVRLLGAHIDGNFIVMGTNFYGPFKNGLDLRYSTVGRAFIWTRIHKTDNTSLTLTGTQIGVLVDDKASWPIKGHLFLDGCVYQRIGQKTHDDPSLNLDDEVSRKDWLERQQEDFRPQPYEMIASVLTARGQGEEATRIRIDEERARQASLNWYSGDRVWTTMLGISVGYGYRPLRAVWFIGLFVFAGWGLFFLGYQRGLIVPTEREAYQSFLYDSTVTPSGYQNFNSFVYSLESFLPLVQLFQLSRWLPDPQSGPEFGGIHAGRLLRSYLWIHVLAGWFFTTMLVAGLTGVVHK